MFSVADGVCMEVCRKSSLTLLFLRIQSQLMLLCVCLCVRVGCKRLENVALVEK